MASFTRLRSGRIHPDAAAESEVGISSAPSLRSLRSQRSFKRMPTGKSDASIDVDTSLRLEDEEHAEWLQHKVKHDGRAATWKLFKFYCRILKPICAVCLFISGMYALLSWTIPNLLCNTVAKENSGSLVFAECLYVDTKDPYSKNWPSKTFFLVYWSIQNGWMAGFCGYICYVLFGPAFRKRERLMLCFISFLAILVSPIAGPRYGLGMKDMRIVMGVVVASGITLMLTANAAARYTGNPLLRLRWIGLLGVGSGVSNVYFLLMPMIITARSQAAMGGMALTFMRLVVHPFLWGILLMTFRFFIRNCGYIPDLRAAVFLNWPLIYATMYGRFLLLQMDSMSSVVIFNLIFAFVELASCLDDRGSDHFLLKLMYGERTRDAMLANRLTDDQRTMDIWMELMMEFSSIFAASAILSLGGVATLPGQSPRHVTIWFGAGLQAVTVLISGFVNFALEGKYHGFEWEKSYTTTPIKIVAMILFTELIGGSRLVFEIIGMFCPTYYPDRDIVLLEQCDKPSLFQAITFASADRFKMVGSIFNVTGIDGVNGAQ
ncbi:hypothetical protein D9Q98_005015 [Chlorella vulgaris]|uniref:Transmembrane protein n=1 Tax=Chlorella vulgaris TaxID=3077 RepID=A0A9D4YWL1_CHLVU|nr:hypothetical protein D9Q98_005015 [Chlorella vulgaris]